MGLSIVGALFALGLALLGQSPRVLKRVGLSSNRVDNRVRAFTGYAFAMVLLSIGFFLAGVPLGSDSNSTEPTAQAADSSLEPAATEDAVRATRSDDIEATGTPSPTTTAITPETGAFSGPPSSTISRVDGPPTTDLNAPIQIGPESLSITLAPTSTHTRTPAPTNTVTPTPTETPTPTLTPTPVTGQTAVVDTGGSTVWLSRSPGGQQLAIVKDREVVIVHNRHANQGGRLWREVSTLDGFGGWLPEEFLVYTE
jgi:hypothetical protein